MIEAVVFDAYGTLYDVQSVTAATEEAFPGRGEYLTQVWRMKQLEYSWLRALMGRYEDFWTVTRDSLAYALGTIGERADGPILDGIARAYEALAPYPDARDALDGLARDGRRLAILSNGAPDMLEAMVARSGLDRHLEATISVHDARTYKPDPRAYALVERRLGVPPGAVAFVSSNGFDVAGAKAFGFTVVRLARAAADPHDAVGVSKLGALGMFRALRMHEEALGERPDAVIAGLAELPRALSLLDGAGSAGA